MSKTMLMVDDDRAFAESVAARCTALGIATEVACNPLTAISIADVQSVDLVCLDVEMPTGNGLSVCEFLSADPATAGLPVIILTGRRDTATIRRCRELGAAYVFKSPNYWPSLRTVIMESLDLAPANSPDKGAE